MGITTKIDKQGRIVIPKEMREKLGWKEETSINIHLMDRKIIIETIEPNLHLAIKEWKEKMISRKVEAFKIPKDEIESSPKWFSEEYTQQKLGL